MITHKTNAPSLSIESRHILGIPVSQVAYEDVMNAIECWIDEADGRAHSIVVANVHNITETALSPAFRQAVSSADMIVPDGMPLVWASRMLGSRLSGRCYGPTLMEKSLDRFQAKGTTHFLYGSTPGVLVRLKHAISTRWPAAGIAGMHSPPFGAMVDDIERANIEDINKSGAQILWVGTGSPKQELWMHRYRSLLKPRVVAGVGAAFDFIAGAKPQAPGWMQDNGLEWFFRLSTEPRRLWKRYLFRNPYFAFQFTLQLLKLRWTNNGNN